MLPLIRPRRPIPAQRADARTRSSTGFSRDGLAPMLFAIIRPMAMFRALFVLLLSSNHRRRIIHAPRRGNREVPVSAHSPWRNPYVERVNGSIRREYLDHVIFHGGMVSPARYERLAQVA